MDLIDRQAAIKTLEKGLPSEPLKSKYTEGITVGFGLAITWIEQLPSVQPQQIVRCKDCKWCENVDGSMCKNPASWVVATDCDFGCVLAERRTDVKST